MQDPKRFSVHFVNFAMIQSIWTDRQTVQTLLRVLLKNSEHPDQTALDNLSDQGLH